MELERREGLEERAGETARRNCSPAPVGPINPYMAAKFLPNSLSLSLSLAHPRPLLRSLPEIFFYAFDRVNGQIPPELNESMCHVKAGYYGGTPGGAAVGQGRRPRWTSRPQNFATGC